MLCRVLHCCCVTGGGLVRYCPCNTGCSSRHQEPILAAHSGRKVLAYVMGKT